ncbi:uncharacterized protein LOC121849215 [Callorhinchus milii]|uniref:uncharacterized protein LOC121849215 n=1 Tax=Callorhinchus milii TaxID=7868 RepID=UPI001C3F50F8|nr:uncharacterized protein LOC121849215 [Callorhinchus milii]
MMASALTDHAQDSAPVQGVRRGGTGRSSALSEPASHRADPDIRTHPGGDCPTSLTLLLELHSRCEGETAVGCGAAGGNRLARWYPFTVAEAENTFELAALLVGVAEVVQGGCTGGCDRDQARSELLAARRLQEFVCRGSASVTPASDPCSGTPSHRALVRAELGLTSAQLKVVEQMCENHHLERLVALGFIYTRMMSPRPEPMAEIRCRERRVELRQQYLHYINGTVRPVCLT